MGSHFSLTFAQSAIAINVSDQDTLFQLISERWTSGRGFALATINLDHIVKLERDPSFMNAYQRADFVVADGRPIVWLSRLAGRPVQLTPGSDLLVPLARLAEHRVDVALVGATEAVLTRAAGRLIDEVPDLQIVAQLAPASGFDPFGAEADRIIQALDACGARLVFLALGAPRQEIFAARCRDELPEVGFACVGAGLDFLAGYQRRAPAWVRSIALEWLWRAASDPRRLGMRYARCAAALPGLVLQAMTSRSSGLDDSHQDWARAPVPGARGPVTDTAGPASAPRAASPRSTQPEELERH